MNGGRTRIVFFGATELGAECCRALFRTGLNVVGIVSIPRHFRFRPSAAPLENVTFYDFGDLASRQGIPVAYVTDETRDSGYREVLESWRPELAVVAGWYYLLPRSILDLFPQGVVGVHASLLPKYRGGSPLVWAIIHGERKTGVTLFYFDEGVDTGDVVGQQEFELLPEDTIKSAYEKATRASVSLVQTYVPLVCEGKAPRISQEHETATRFPPRQPEDGLIDWSKSPEEIRNFIRAQSKPYPGAYTIIDGKKVVIFDAEIGETGKDQS